MPSTPSKRADGALTLADLRELGICPEDVDDEWMDEMVKRLFHELRKQLSQLEMAMKDGDNGQQAARRATNARTLDGIERTLERLNRLQQSRVSVRETKVTAKNDDIRAELERRLDKLLAAKETQPLSEESER